ncbi:MAG: hypothetical protein PVS3B3_12600 [Ktedonobacteraceae bacterium]
MLFFTEALIMSITDKHANVPATGVDEHTIPDERQGDIPVPFRWRTTLAQVWAFALLPFLVSRLLLLLVGVVTVTYIEPLVNRKQPIVLAVQQSHFPAILWWMWSRFDTGFYIDIAQHGYWGRGSLLGQSNWAFFPLYPLLIRLLAFPFSASQHHPYLFAGLAITNISALVALFYFYKLTARELNTHKAAKAVMYLAFFPMSFFLSTVYPESLFLALSVACVYYARLHRWWLAGLLGGLASLTRPQGVLLLVVVAWEYWQVVAEQRVPLQESQGFFVSIQSWLRSRFLGLGIALRTFSFWRGIVALLQIPLGLALFCIYGKWQVGSFLPFEITERNGWGRHFIDPVSSLILLLTKPQPANPYDWSFYGLNVVVIVGFLLLLVPIFRKLPAIYGIFSLVFIILPLCTTSTQSSARFYMEVFPIYMLIALWTSRGSVEWQTTKHTMVVCSFAVLLGVATVLWTLGVYSMS